MCALKLIRNKNVKYDFNIKRLGITQSIEY